ncbi:MAG: pilus assembly protein TadG-related protein [Rhodospirillaceae bacterium]|nr:pilus assembly protein TadG-related protein [Rhodospirillaceae bacterium]
MIWSKIRLDFLLRTMRSFKRSQGGAVIILWALAAIPVVVGVGAAVDLSRAYMAKSRLAFALDAAGLAAGAAGETETEMQAIAEQFFEANYPSSLPGTPSTPVLTVDGGVIKVSGTVTLEPTLLQLIGQEDFTVAASSEVLRKGLEVALILDNTGSMKGSKLESLRTASQDLVDILFAVPELQSNLSVGIVPYSATVNLGAAALGIVSGVAPEEFDPNDDEKWQGCVLGRTYPADVQDVPSGGGQLWAKYFWESAADNDWPVADTTPSLCNNSTGPNVACPTPITPLTNDKTVLDSAVGAMEAWCRGGTFSNVGMAWGWRVLSPEEPYSEGLPYATPGFDKVAILMTDGVNGYFKKPGSPFTSDYSAYERLSEGNLGTTNKSAAKTELNNRLTEVCNNMKAAGIIIYTITFSLNNETTKTIYRNCATDTSKYFDSGNGPALQQAFQDIAEELINLRVSK